MSGLRAGLFWHVSGWPRMHAALRTHLTFPDVHGSEHSPRVALLAVGLDRRAGLQAGALGEDQVGELVDIDEVVVMAQRLTEQTLDSNPEGQMRGCCDDLDVLVNVRVQVVEVEVDIDHALPRSATPQRRGSPLTTSEPSLSFPSSSRGAAFRLTLVAAGTADSWGFGILASGWFGVSLHKS